jgi:CheY-like chemotaxis protein
VTSIGSKSGKPTVLVVDDNTDAVDALAQILEYEGYAVATAHDGREALEYLGGHPTPDLIVLDLMMPIMNGWELRAELAKVPAFAKVPIVVMTALAQSAKIEADAILAKPIDLKRLLLVMDRLLARRENTNGSMSRA